MRKVITFFLALMLLCPFACGEAVQTAEPAEEPATEITILPGAPATLLETEDYKIWFTGGASNQSIFGHFDLYIAFENNSDAPAGASASNVTLNGWNHDMMPFTGTIEPGAKQKCSMCIFYGSAMLKSPTEMKELAFDLDVFQVTDHMENASMGRYVFTFDPSCWGN